ncbi:DUF1707 domain-containing protein [Streptosporangium sp. NBC_01755]|uniref:DUF1707 SHOCT-like domain-containing protein n=1 Tax=unclassified Streptosporangium TaxID=2632669 RepID=UPI002DDA543B|nr:MULTISPECIES: DUF1707 domain-containing protein [unclassified Streptosporangium]WSA27491.1 DUF1707 domain-containing protein [Streptosporangium sp. NBC_01810]WSD01038.1 DUF1707 domain-containing protein [Streptosporangium sp. NBC_01755]
MTPRDDLRIGDAERDAAMEALREHYAKGRLTREELDERLELTLSARTGGDLAVVCADLPGPRDPGPEEFEDAGSPWGREWHAHARGVHHPGFRPGSRIRHRAAWSHHHAGHRGGPPFAPVVVLLLVAGVAVAGVGVLKFLLLAWLAMAVLGLLRRRRWHSRARAGRFGPPGAF